MNRTKRSFASNKENNSSNKRSTVSSGYTVLMLHVEEGNLEEIKSMFDRGAIRNINTQSKTGQTALALAARNGNLAIAECLVSQGAELNIQNKSGQTPLFIACWFGFYNIVELFLRENANVNLPDYRGWTPLMIACYHGYKDIVQLLLQSNADITAIDCFGKRASDRCKDPSIFEMLKIIEERLRPSTRRADEKSCSPPNNIHSIRRTSKNHGASTEREKSKEHAHSLDERYEVLHTLSDNFAPKRSVSQFIHDLEIFKMHKRAGYYPQLDSNSKSSARSIGISRRSEQMSYPDIDKCFGETDGDLVRIRSCETNPFSPGALNQSEDININAESQAKQSGTLKRNRRAFSNYDDNMQGKKAAGRTKGSPSLSGSLGITRDEIEELVFRKNSLKKESSVSRSKSRKASKESVKDYSKKDNTKKGQPPSERRSIIEEVSKDFDIKKGLGSYIKDYSIRMDKVVNKKVSYALNFEWKRNAYRVRKVFSQYLAEQAKETIGRMMEKIESNYLEYMGRNGEESELSGLEKVRKEFMGNLKSKWETRSWEEAFEVEERGLEKILMGPKEIDKALLAELNSEFMKEMGGTESAREQELMGYVKNELQINIDRVFGSLNDTIAKELSKAESLVARLMKESAKGLFESLEKIVESKETKKDGNISSRNVATLQTNGETLPSSRDRLKSKDTSKGNSQGKKNEKLSPVKTKKVEEVKTNSGRKFSGSIETRGSNKAKASEQPSSKSILVIDKISPIEPVRRDGVTLGGQKSKVVQKKINKPLARDLVKRKNHSISIDKMSPNLGVSDFLNSLNVSIKEVEGKEGMLIEEELGKESGTRDVVQKKGTKEDESTEEQEEMREKMTEQEEKPEIEETPKACGVKNRNRNSEQAMGGKEEEKAEKIVEEYSERKDSEPMDKRVSPQGSEEGGRKSSEQGSIKEEVKSKFSKLDSLWQRFGEMVSKPTMKDTRENTTDESLSQSSLVSSKYDVLRPAKSEGKPESYSKSQGETKNSLDSGKEELKKDSMKEVTEHLEAQERREQFNPTPTKGTKLQVEKYETIRAIADQGARVQGSSSKATGIFGEKDSESSSKDQTYMKQETCDETRRTSQETKEGGDTGNMSKALEDRIDDLGIKDLKGTGEIRERQEPKKDELKKEEEKGLGTDKQKNSGVKEAGNVRDSETKDVNRERKDEGPSVQDLRDMVQNDAKLKGGVERVESPEVIIIDDESVSLTKNKRSSFHVNEDVKKLEDSDEKNENKQEEERQAPLRHKLQDIVAMEEGRGASIPKDNGKDGSKVLVVEEGGNRANESLFEVKSQELTESAKKGSELQKIDNILGKVNKQEASNRYNEKHDQTVPKELVHHDPVSKLKQIDDEFFNTPGNSNRDNAGKGLGKIDEKSDEEYSYGYDYSHSEEDSKITVLKSNVEKLFERAHQKASIFSQMDKDSSKSRNNESSLGRTVKSVDSSFNTNFSSFIPSPKMSSQVKSVLQCQVNQIPFSDVEQNKDQSKFVGSSLNTSSLSQLKTFFGSVNLPAGIMSQNPEKK